MDISLLSYEGPQNTSAPAFVPTSAIFIQSRPDTPVTSDSGNALDHLVKYTAMNVQPLDRTAQLSGIPK
jgi:hypothetical protein